MCLENYQEKKSPWLLLLLLLLSKIKQKPWPDKTNQQKKKSHTRRHKNQKPTHLHILESIKVLN